MLKWPLQLQKLSFVKQWIRADSCLNEKPYNYLKMFTRAYNFKINKITRSFIIYKYNLLK